MWSRVNALAPRRALARPDRHGPRGRPHWRRCHSRSWESQARQSGGTVHHPHAALRRPASGDDVIVRAAVVGAIASPLSRRSGQVLTIASATLPMAADGAGRRRGGRADSPGPRKTRRGWSSRSPASRYVVLGGQVLRDRLGGGGAALPVVGQSIWIAGVQSTCAAQELSLVVSGETRSAWATGRNRADRSVDLGRRAGTARRARPRERKRYS